MIKFIYFFVKDYEIMKIFRKNLQTANQIQKNQNLKTEYDLGPWHFLLLL